MQEPELTEFFGSANRDFVLDCRHAGHVTDDRFGVGPQRVAVRGKMAGDDLICPPSIPPAIIQQAVWLYFRFTLSFRDVEDLLSGARNHGLLRNGSALGEFTSGR